MRYIVLKFIGVMMTIIAFMLIATPVYAMDPPDNVPTIESMKVYRNLLETGDRLIVVYFNLPYATIPNHPVVETYIWQFIDTDGTTVLGTTIGYDYVYSGYRYQVISFYFPDSAGITWNPATPYTVRLIGNPMHFDDIPEYNFSVNSAYYTLLSDFEDVRAELASDILNIADDLDIKWGLETPLITEEETQKVLSIFGQAYFRGVIYGIQVLAPDLFPLGVINIDIESRTWTDSYVTDLDKQYTGTWVETAKEAGGLLFSINYDLLSLILLGAMATALIIANISLTNDHWNGIIDATVIAVMATRIGMLGLGYLSLAAALCLIYIGFRLKQMGIFGD